MRLYDEHTNAMYDLELTLCGNAEVLLDSGLDLDLDARRDAYGPDGQGENEIVSIAVRAACERLCAFGFYDYKIETEFSAWRGGRCAEMPHVFPVAWRAKRLEWDPDDFEEGDWVETGERGLSPEMHEQVAALLWSVRRRAEQAGQQAIEQDVESLREAEAEEAANG